MTEDELYKELDRFMEQIEETEKQLKSYAGKQVAVTMTDGEVFSGRCTFGGIRYDYYEDGMPFTGVEITLSELPVAYVLEYDDIERIDTIG